MRDTFTKTSIYVEFDVGDDFAPEQLTEQLKIQPSLSYKKGEKKHPLVEGSELRYKFSRWALKSKEMESEKIESHINQIFDMLKNKVDVLNEFKKNNPGLIYKIWFVINVRNSEIPKILLPHYFIHFVDSVTADIGFDFI